MTHGDTVAINWLPVRFWHDHTGALSPPKIRHGWDLIEMGSREAAERGGAMTKTRQVEAPLAQDMLHTKSSEGQALRQRRRWRTMDKEWYVETLFGKHLPFQNCRSLHGVEVHAVAASVSSNYSLHQAPLRESGHHWAATTLRSGLFLLYILCLRMYSHLDLRSHSLFPSSFCYPLGQILSTQSHHELLGSMPSIRRGAKA